MRRAFVLMFLVGCSSSHNDNSADGNGLADTTQDMAMAPTPIGDFASSPRGAFLKRKKFASRKIGATDRTRSDPQEHLSPVRLRYGHLVQDKRLSSGFQNHRAHEVEAILGEEHVLGTAEADAFRSERTRLDGVARNVSIRAHADGTVFFRPVEQLL